MCGSGRASYDILKKYILDPSVNKVVILAHSQGGIIASMVLDRLFAEIPADMMCKLVSTHPLVDTTSIRTRAPNKT